MTVYDIGLLSITVVMSKGGDASIKRPASQTPSDSSPQPLERPAGQTARTGWIARRPDCQPFRRLPVRASRRPAIATASLPRCQAVRRLDGSPRGRLAIQDAGLRAFEPSRSLEVERPDRGPFKRPDGQPPGLLAACMSKGVEGHAFSGPTVTIAGRSSPWTPRPPAAQPSRPPAVGHSGGLAIQAPGRWWSIPYGRRGKPRMRRIVIASQKGGVAKSTTATCLAVGLARAGTRHC